MRVWRQSEALGVRLLPMALLVAMLKSEEEVRPCTSLNLPPPCCTSSCCTSTPLVLGAEAAREGEAVLRGAGPGTLPRAQQVLVLVFLLAR